MVWPLVAARYPRPPSRASPTSPARNRQGCSSAAAGAGDAGQCRGVPVAAQTHFCSAGMEVAAYLAERAHSVSLVELEEVPFKKFFGERVGRAVMKVTLLSHPGVVLMTERVLLVSLIALINLLFDVY